MASLLGKELFQISGQGPPPSKDFFQLVVTRDQVMLITWSISLQRGNRGVPPKKQMASHSDFLVDKGLHYEICNVFGERILNYTILLSEGKIDYLERMPDDLLLKILSYIDVNDTPFVSLVSRRFRQICNSNAYWERIVKCCPDFTSDMEDIGNAMGWRRTFFTYFYMNGRERHEDSD